MHEYAQKAAWKRLFLSNSELFFNAFDPVETSYPSILPGNWQVGLFYNRLLGDPNG
jgi:hypothetical protein